MAKVFVYDEFNPQDLAMMQALYSRSPLSVTEHVEKVRKAGSGKFMEQFYVGYGHMSIADCGSTTLFIEGLSILADKAVQDWPLYNGQETSTRYIDMSKMPLIDPVGTPESKKIQDRWMAFYLGSMPEVEEHLKKKYPKKPEEDERVYEKALKARAFDSLRGFLPAGITTQLSWHTNLRQAWDKLALLRHHPLSEVSELAEVMISTLKDKYPHSFSHKLYESQEEYRDYVVKEYSYFHPGKDHPEFAYTANVRKEALGEYEDVLAKRPQKTNLPYFMGEFGQITFDFRLDFGSFRDVQRHRSSIWRMPLLTTELGFNEWYLEQLPDKVRKAAEGLIAEQVKAIAKIECTPEVKQYYTAMGFDVAARMTFTLPSVIYVAELRSGKTVHPSLRRVVHKICEALSLEFPTMALHADMDLDDWDVRRGLQDIAVK